MPRNFDSLPPHTVTRTDREVTDEAWIKRLLRLAPMGILATQRGGQPFVNSNLFVYDESAHAIYFHTAKVGRTRSNIERDERVCFTVTTMGRLLPASEALEFSVEYSGVVVFGRARVVEDQEEARWFLQRLLDKYAPHLKAGKDYRPPIDEEIKRTTVYHIAIDSWSGKKKEAEPEFPGAYRYEDVIDTAEG